MSGPAYFSASRGLCGCVCLRPRRRLDRLGGYFLSILVHVESLFPVQAFDKPTCRLSYGSGKSRGIDFDCRFHRPLIPILIAKSNLTCFHPADPSFVLISSDCPASR